MYSSRIVEQVIRAPKPLTGVLKVVMIVFAVIFLLLGVVISRGFMLSGFLFVVLYYFYNVCSRKEYEYIRKTISLPSMLYWGKVIADPVMFLIWMV